MDTPAAELSRNDVSTTECRAAEDKENTNDGTPPRTTLSRLATSLPVELVEMTLNSLSTEDLMFPAAYLPKLFRDVLEGSLQLRKKIQEHKFESFWKTREFVSTFKTGTLYVLSSKMEDNKTGDAFMFAPRSGENKLQIIDPETKFVEYRTTGRLGTQGFIKLFDMEGHEVCAKYVQRDDEYELQRYVWDVYEAGFEKKRGKKRKQGKLQQEILSQRGEPGG